MNLLKTFFLLFLQLGLFINADGQDSITYRVLPAAYKSLEKCNQPKEFTFGELKVTAINTGFISTDHAFPEPVFVWLVSSPEGHFLIDAGLSPEVLNKKYFEGFSQYFFRHEFQFFIYPENNLLNQLEKLGVKESNLKAILLTHAHFDHIGYLPWLKSVKVIMTRKEEEQVKESGQLAGYQKNTSTIIGMKRVEGVEIEKGELKALNSVIRLLRVDEHTKGHEMILIELKDGKRLLFTGDLNIEKMDKDSELYKFLDQKIGLASCKTFFNHCGAL